MNSHQSIVVSHKLRKKNTIQLVWLLPLLTALPIYVYSVILLNID